MMRWVTTVTIHPPPWVEKELLHRGTMTPIGTNTWDWTNTI